MAATARQCLKSMGWATPFPMAPEICAEVMSPGNSWAEMHMKAGLYMQAGALEVWVVGADGKTSVLKPPSA
jgi:Uma2 family endonuclease